MQIINYEIRYNFLSHRVIEVKK